MSVLYGSDADRRRPQPGDPGRRASATARAGAPTRRSATARPATSSATTAASASPSASCGRRSPPRPARSTTTSRRPAASATSTSTRACWSTTPASTTTACSRSSPGTSNDRNTLTLRHRSYRADETGFGFVDPVAARRGRRLPDPHHLSVSGLRPHRARLGRERDRRPDRRQPAGAGLPAGQRPRARQRHRHQHRPDLPRRARLLGRGPEPQRLRARDARPARRGDPRAAQESTAHLRLRGLPGRLEQHRRLDHDHDDPLPVPAVPGGRHLERHAPERAECREHELGPLRPGRDPDRASASRPRSAPATRRSRPRPRRPRTGTSRVSTSRTTTSSAPSTCSSRRRENLNLLASWGTAFRAPNIIERLFNGPTPEGAGYQILNADLTSETSENFDFGLKYRRQDAYFEAVWFRNDLTDGIVQHFLTDAEIAALPADVREAIASSGIRRRRAAAQRRQAPLRGDRERHRVPRAVRPLGGRQLDPPARSAHRHLRRAGREPVLRQDRRLRALRPSLRTLVG